MYIFKHDFIAIKDAISSGKELPQQSYNEWVGLTGSDKNSKADKRKPYIKEMHASKRESVLKAAIYTMLNYPEQCKGNMKWAEAINDHAHKFWSDGKPPLSIEVTAKLLGNALKPEKYRE